MLNGALACPFVALICALSAPQSVSAQSQLPQPDPAFLKAKIASNLYRLNAELPAAGEGRNGRPNVLIILLDDVGFGMCSTFGGPVPTPNLDKLAKNGLKYTRFHTTALCQPDARRAARRPQPPQYRHRRDHRDGHGLPRLHGHHPAGARRWCRRCSRDNGYATAHVRQVAQHAGAGHQPGRAVRPLAHGPRVRLLLRLQPGRDAPVLSDAVSQHDSGARSRSRRKRAITSPRT